MMAILARVGAMLGTFRGERDSIETAIAELSRWSDRDLADLGIARGDIREAVLYGRPGIDDRRAVNDDRPRSVMAIEVA